MKKDALIIGNGSTRNKFNLKKAKKDFATFGCNALYRDFKPDYIVSLDNGMIREILDSEYKGKLFVPDEDDQYEPERYNPNRPRENAGMVAMRLAIDLGHTNLHCIGMDFLIDNYDINMMNMYFGTANYGSKTRSSFVDSENRAKYFAWFTKQYPHVKFNMLFPKGLVNYRRIDVGSNVVGGIISDEYYEV